MTGTRKLASTLVLAIATVASLAGGTPALADDYSYTVRVFGGNMGTVDGSDVRVIECHKGDVVDLTQDVSVEVSDPAYYHKGFRESGQDDELRYRVFTVDRDIDIVASYGMSVDMVHVTLRFREYGTGKPLTDDNGQSEVTYECKSGDTPVIAFRHVEGYRPLYRNVTGTVKEDTVWYLDYAPLAPGEEEVYPTSTQQVEAGTDSGTAGTDGTTNAANATAPDATGADGDAAGADTTQTPDANTTQGDAGTTQGDDEPPATQEILDNDTPLGSLSNDEGNGDERPFDAALWARKHSIVLAAAVAGVIAALFAIIVWRRRRRDDERQQ